MREEINKRCGQEQEFCQICQKRTGEYAKVLKLSFQDLTILYNIEEDRMPSADEQDETEWFETPAEFWFYQKVCGIEKAHGFLDIEVDGERFYLTICFSALPSMHDGATLSLLLAVCKSNEELNNALYGSSYYFNYVPEEWHEKIIAHLKKEKDDLTP